MTNALCIYITGLPGAGKSTIGKYVSESLSISLLDKDDYLESLFENHGIGGINQRQKLSREADVLFRTAAESENKVVLVSHWRPKNLQVDYGTPCTWIKDTFSTVIEIYCACSVGEASKRFRSRVRHPGHVDESRSTPEINAWLRAYAAHLPINVGRSFMINTENGKWKSKLSGIIQKYS